MMKFWKKPVPVTPPEPRRTLARWDAAETTGENAAHWSLATDWSADVEANAGTRRILRRRSRYESENNPWVMGMITTLANDLIGTGPRLQMSAADRKLNKELEYAFADWAEAVNLAGTMLTAQMAKCRDGETFILFGSNPRLRNAVKLNLTLIEADQIASSQSFDLWDEKEIDGIHLDDYGNVESYNLLRHHPGAWVCGFGGESTKIKADYMAHLFRRHRPGQHRGVPDITPALPYFALLRRYTLAMVKKMETSANLSGVLEQENLTGEPVQTDNWATFDLPRDSFMTLLPGMHLVDHNIPNPTDSQNNFSIQIKTEVARCLGLPKNVALGDSSGYNYSSGRLDFQVYDKFLAVERKQWERELLNRVFALWSREYLLLSGKRTAEPLYHCWFWDGRDHVDPAKSASAQAAFLANGTTTLAYECAKQGRDWEEVLEQRKIENDKLRELGLQLTGENQTEGKNDDDNE